MDSPEVVVASSTGVGTLNPTTSQPIGLNASMTLRIVPSLPAASMPWRTMRTGCFASANSRSWSEVSRASSAASSSTAWAFSWPSVAPASNPARWTLEPGAIRSASPSRRFGVGRVIGTSLRSGGRSRPGPRIPRRAGPDRSGGPAVAAAYHGFTSPTAIGQPARPKETAAWPPRPSPAPIRSSSQAAGSSRPIRWSSRTRPTRARRPVRPSTPPRPSTRRRSAPR